MFPRLAYFKITDNLLAIHLAIFEFLKPLFTSYIDNRENISSVCNSFKDRKAPVSHPNQKIDS